MGFFKKHFGHGQSSRDGDQTASSGQGTTGVSNSREKPPSYTKEAGKEGYEAPPGPPPSRRPQHADAQDYAPPPGPPPGRQAASSNREEYAPPPGPPPGRRASDSKQEEFAPPPGAPPGYEDEPPNYHDWQSAVPDTSLLPPPPAISNDFSPLSNASNQEARQAWDWCKEHPLRPAVRPEQRFVEPYLSGDVALRWPGTPFAGEMSQVRSGVWSGSSRRGAGDQTFLTNVPLYFALSDDAPKMSGRTKTAYYELQFAGQGRADREGNPASLAIGYAAHPYPIWRMPGWERGSLAVHSDDGRRFVNNQDGGLDFVDPFQPGVTVGLGIRYWVGRGGGAAGTANGLRGEAFFTRNGRLEGTWSLQEEMDGTTGEYGNWGVAGDHDLFGAIGTFGEIAFKAVFKPKEWAFDPETLPPPREA